MKFVIGRTLTILSWDNPVTAYFRKTAQQPWQAIAQRFCSIGIYIKGLFSLFGMSALLYGNHHMCMEDALKKMGSFKEVIG